MMLLRNGGDQISVPGRDRDHVKSGLPMDLPLLPLNERKLRLKHQKLRIY
jgi:hypothetical protein